MYMREQSVLEQEIELGGWHKFLAKHKNLFLSVLYTYLKPMIFPLAARKLPPGDTSVPLDELTPVSVESLAPGFI